MKPERPCPACGDQVEADELLLPELMFGLDETFPYCVCRSCETLFIREVPADLSDYYTKKYYSFDLDPEQVLGQPVVARAVAAVGRSLLLGHGAVAGGVRICLPQRQVRTLMALLASIRWAGLPRGRRSRILDLGSGSGVLVYALSLVGFDEVTGADPFVAAERLFTTGARVLKRTVDEIDGSYDLVMLHHSLEHVPDPGATLAQAAARLAPEGRVLVRMPTVSSEAFRRYGSSWIQLDPPRHLSLMSRAGVQHLAQSAALTVKRVRDDSSSFQFWGSEQVRSGIPLVAAASHFLRPSQSPFTRAQIREWDRQAAELNAQNRGDQAAWVLQRP